MEGENMGIPPTPENPESNTDQEIKELLEKGIPQNITEKDLDKLLDSLREKGVDEQVINNLLDSYTDPHGITDQLIDVFKKAAGVNHEGKLTTEEKARVLKLVDQTFQKKE